MCTAITFHGKDHYFGRNLDLEYRYQERVTITPRSFPFVFRNGTCITDHAAFIGMATIADGYPLYYDATNEYGLSMAGLNFPGNAIYHPKDCKKDNLAPFELIPWILCQCRTVEDAYKLLLRCNLWDEHFNTSYPLSPLHWLIADRTISVVIEPMADGLHIHSNPVGVLTNNPPFDYHMYNLANYMNISPENPANPYAAHFELKPYGRGHGGIGLPGDLSSTSRFVRATFTKFNAVHHTDELSAVGQFFHILGAVEQQEGSVKVGEKYEKTVYSSCCNTNTGTYYYCTYGNRQITAVRMSGKLREGKDLSSYPLIDTQQIHIENAL